MYICQKCCKLFSTQFNLDRHLHKKIPCNEETSKSYEKHSCKKCNKDFSSKYGLNYHIKNNVCKAQIFICPKCNKPFNFEHELNLHIQNHHNIIS